MFLKIRAGWSWCVEKVRDYLQTQKEYRAIIDAVVDDHNAANQKFKVFPWTACAHDDEYYLVVCVRFGRLLAAKHYLYVIRVSSRSLIDSHELTASPSNLKVDLTHEGLNIAVWHSDSWATQLKFDYDMQELRAVSAAA